MYYSIKIYFDGRCYKYVPLLGRVLSYSSLSHNSDHNSIKILRIKEIMAPVDNPFLLEYRGCASVEHVSIFIREYAKLLVFSYRHCYLLFFLLSFLRFPVFDDAGVSNMVFRSIFNQDKQTSLCLPRSVFIATTSKRFNKHGAMFIGVFLPTRNMHAWVIEDNSVADVFDYTWTMYTPISILK